MNHLRQALGKPRVNEVTDLLATYFKGTRRRNGESMNEFITRKNEAYMRASQAMKRVQPFYEAGGARTSTSTWTPGRRDSMDSTSSWHWGRQWTPAAESEEGRGGTADEEATNDGSTTATEGREATQHTAWHAWRPYYGNSYGGWNWSSSWYGSGGDWDWSAASSSAETEASGSSSVELLPAFIQGWYLLMDSNLDHNERNLVVTALNGNFSPQRVGQELRNQFPEGETRRRDSRKYQSYIGEANDPPDEDYEENQATTMEELIAEGLSEEGVALMADAEGQAQEALAALFEARRTLKDARHKQKVVKQNRKYFHGNGGQAKGSGTGSARPRDDSNLDCLRCGHRAANCPHKPVGAAAQVDQASSSGSYEQAPFVCVAEMIMDTSGEQGTSNHDSDFAGYAHMILLNAMDSMNKTDLVLHLRAYGEEPPEEWTKMELKQRIKDLMDRGEMPAIKTSKERTPLQVATGELNKASRKKADLIKYVANEYQIEATSNDTIGTMQRKAMVKILERTTPVGSDVMGFGKFASRTYHDVWSTEINYVEWARQTEMEGDVSIYLKRFIRWVKDYAEIEEINATRKVTPKAKTKPSPKSKVPPKGYRAETHEETPSSSSTSPDVAALTAVVAQLVQEVQSMKEEKGEKPRKLVARDTEMNHKDNR
ncbi:unnamed protein product, partial [Symbiodinium microadriaticum]